jgi:hypothetical protein
LRRYLKVKRGCEIEIDWSEHFYYDPDSPSGLRWKYDKFPWKHNAGKQITFKDGVAGSRTDMGYWRTRLDGKNHMNHKIVWEMLNGSLNGLTIDHIDGNQANNAIGNLRATTIKINSRNRRLSDRNTSGVSGVSRLIHSSGREYWIASWYEEDKRQVRVSFSIAKLGEDRAFIEAVECRRTAICRRQAEGAGYTERHIDINQGELI